MTFSCLFKGHGQTTLVSNLIAVFLVLKKWDGGKRLYKSEAKFGTPVLFNSESYLEANGNIWKKSIAIRKSLS